MKDYMYAQIYDANGKHIDHWRALGKLFVAGDVIERGVMEGYIPITITRVEDTAYDDGTKYQKVFIEEGEVIALRLSPRKPDDDKPKWHQDHDSGKIEEHTYCKQCHFPVVFVCCNGTMQDFAVKQTGDMWDWWLYCANKGCVNHKGEGLWQGTPDWVYKYDNRQAV